MNTLRALTATWRKEALTFRRYGEERLAVTCEIHADEVEAAAAAMRIEAVSLEEAGEIGGYSYSHLQCLVARGEIENIGHKGSPRIRRCDIPMKPGRGKGRTRSKANVLDRSLKVHRAEAEG